MFISIRKFKTHIENNIFNSYNQVAPSNNLFNFVEPKLIPTQSK